MDSETIFTLFVVVLTIFYGIGNFMEGVKVIKNQEYSLKKAQGLKNIKVTRRGKNTRPFGVAYCLYGVTIIVLLFYLLLTGDHNPSVLCFGPIVFPILIPIFGKGMSENRFYEEEKIERSNGLHSQ
jgi:hypothetical protein